MFKTGDAVKYVFPPIDGTVLGAQVDADSNVFYLVEYTDSRGEVQQRYFPADALVAA
jgi:hypothetical protein